MSQTESVGEADKRLRRIRNYSLQPDRVELSNTVSGSFYYGSMGERLAVQGSSTRSSRHYARSFNNMNSMAEPLLARSQINPSDSIHYDSLYDSQEFQGRRNAVEVIRKRLSSHFMNPYQKYKHRGRKPWKLLVQLLKIVLVTTQVVLFGSELFSTVNYLDDTTQTFNHLFLNRFHQSRERDIYKKTEFYEHVQFAHKQYYKIHDIAVGIYRVPIENNTNRPMQICIYKYKRGFVDPGNETYFYDPETEYLYFQVCWNLLPYHANDSLQMFVEKNNLEIEFDSMISVQLNATIKSLHLKSMTPPVRPDCYKFNVTIKFDNGNHDGKIPVVLSANPQLEKNCHGTLTEQPDDKALKMLLIAFDTFVIITCFLSFLLCLRSLLKHFKLVRSTRKFFLEQLSDHLSYWDCLDLVNLWFVLIVCSDVCTVMGSVYKLLIDQKVCCILVTLWLRLNDFCTVMGSVYKLLIDQKVTYNYDICSIFLGIGVLLTWVGVLRYLTYMQKYNLLLVTLKASAPSVLRFCVCASLLYFGFAFCGWIVLGPYHPKFRNLWIVSECMFSLINGDDMFMTFAEMQKSNQAVWIFSKVYLYTFISLFIYVVLSLFIGIISDTYERMKDWGHPMCTKLQRFVHGPHCQRCAAEFPVTESEVHAMPSPVLTDED